MSHPPSDTYRSYLRRCVYVFIAVLCGTLLMVAASFVPLGNRRLNVALVLAAACGNAFLVAGYLMHLISERKMVYTLLLFTAIFFIGLMGLTVFAHGDVPFVKGP
jgi:caa(3)-type oxidase subunit IV